MDSLWYIYKYYIASGNLTVCELERSTIAIIGESAISMAIFHSYVTNYQRVVRWDYKSTYNLATAPCTHRNPGHQMSPIKIRVYAQVHVEIFQFLLSNCRSEYPFFWLLTLPPVLRVKVTFVADGC